MRCSILQDIALKKSLCVGNGQSTFGGPKWTSSGQNGPFWSNLCPHPVRNKVILTKMVIWTILGQFGPAHFRTVLRPLPNVGFFFQENEGEEAPTYKESGLSNLCAAGPFGSLGGYSLCAPFAL